MELLQKSMEETETKIDQLKAKIGTHREQYLQALLLDCRNLATEGRARIRSADHFQRDLQRAEGDLDARQVVHHGPECPAWPQHA